MTTDRITSTGRVTTLALSLALFEHPHPLLPISSINGEDEHISGHFENWMKMFHCPTSSEASE